VERWSLDIYGNIRFPIGLIGAKATNINGRILAFGGIYVHNS
jgi:hypothetical protein